MGSVGLDSLEMSRGSPVMERKLGKDRRASRLSGRRRLISLAFLVEPSRTTAELMTISAPCLLARTPYTTDEGNIEARSIGQKEKEEEVQLLFCYFLLPRVTSMAETTLLWFHLSSCSLTKSSRRVGLR
ncbi:hypothetical protein GW17_00001372 [Ensete ventricosum]|nr:hypothetical protein GW17_00001372 [Ensete ventricosum]